MHNLRIELRPKEHPFKADPGAYLEAWGSIAGHVYDGSDDLKLLQIEWDVLDLVEWFVANKVVIATEDFSMLGEKANPGESISEALHRIGVQKFSLPFQKPDDVIGQEMAVYDTYYIRHSPHRDMIGSGMPEILIGINNSVGEISLLNETQNWKYEFDMGVFMNDFINESKRFIAEWLGTTQNSDAQNRGLQIVNGL